MRGRQRHLAGESPGNNSNVPDDVPNGDMSQWVSNTPTIQTSSDILYVNLEETYPSSPPFLERDPNMSSTARYSPLNSAPTSQPCLPPLRHAPLLQTYQHVSKTIPSMPPNSLCEDNRNILTVGTFTLSPNANPNNQTIDDINSNDISQYMNSYPTHIDVTAVNSDLQPQPPILNAMDRVTCSDDVVQHDGNDSFYSQQVYHSDGYEVTSSSEGVYITTTSSVSNGENADAAAAQMIDTTNDMLVFSSDGDFQMIGKNSLKPEQVSLLISGAQPGMSYSLSKENGFIIARPTNSVKNEVNMSDLSALDDFSQCSQQNYVKQETASNLGLNQHSNSQSPNNAMSVDMSVKDESESQTSFNNNKLDDDDDIEFVDINDKKRNRKLPLNSDISVTCIPDKSVPCRAKASLPATHLWLRNNSINNAEVLGVFARRRIPLRARFGPLEGVRIKLPQELSQVLAKSGPHFLIHTGNGDYSIDISDEKTSNWMRYVRFAPGPNQNLCLQQLDNGLFFTSLKPIPPRSELLFGYGISYARHWNLPFPSQRTQDDDESIEWPCFECPMQFSSSPELQVHLNTHDDDDKFASVRKIKRKISKYVSNLENHCNVCKRTFPRNYSLKRHMRIHENNVDSTTNLRKAIECNSDLVRVSKSSDFSNPKSIDNSECAASNILIQNQKMNDEINEKDDITCSLWPTNEEQISKNNLMAIEPSQSLDENKCTECDAKFSSLEKLNHHSADHKNENSNSLFYMSLDMNVDLDNQILLNENTENIKTETSCTICEKTFTCPNQLTDHIEEQHKHSDGTYQCPVCNKKLSEYNLLKKHFHGKHSVQKFQCQHCSVSFNTKDKLQNHMTKHRDNNEFICPNCNKQFKRKDKLKEHIRRQQRVVNNNKEIIYLCSERANGSLSTNHEDPSAYLHFTFKCHPCRLGFKRRGMLVNHLARRHPEISRASVPELQLPILRTARDYFCQHCDKVYKSSSKRKAHILKNHPGESLPPSSRGLGSNESNLVEILDYSACVGSVPSAPHHCPYTPCHKQYASKAKLSQHIKHKHLLPTESKENTQINNTHTALNVDNSELKISSSQADLSDQIPNFLSEMNYQTNGEDKITSGPLISDASSPPKSRKSLPPLQQMLLFNKCHKFRDDALPEANAFAQNTDAEQLLEDNLKISNQFHINDLIKTLSEMKNAKSQDAGLKQSYVISKSEWKSQSDPTTVLGSLKYEPNYLHLIHIADGVEILDKHPLNVNPLNKDIGNQSLIINDLPKLHISGHILSVEANKLPPVSVLSSNNITAGLLGTQYTDR